MKKIDLQAWNRREIFEHFRRFTDPCYTVSFPVDVTKLYAYKSAHHISFYFALCWLCAEAMNAVESFRYVMRGDELFLLDRRIPSPTDRRSDGETFICIVPPYSDDLDAYCASARQCSAEQTVFIDPEKESDDLIFFSCFPTLRVLSVTNPRDFHNPDAYKSNVTSVTWGKYADINGRKELNLSVEANHCFVDGVHIERFAAELERLIDALQV